MQKVHLKNQNKFAYIIFYMIGIVCGFAAIAVIVQIIFAYQSGEAFAYVSTRSSTMLNVASRDSSNHQFWFYMTAWGVGAVLLLYLSFRFIQIAKAIGRELQNKI
jgi:hypothetical protein